MTTGTGATVSVANGLPENELTDYTAFFEASGGHLVRLAYLLLGDLGDAEDVAQEVLVEVYRRWSTLRPETVTAYARTAVVNRSRSLLRRRAVARKFAPRLVETDRVEALPVADRWLWDHVQALPRRQREVVVLRYWCDLSEAEIARVLGISAGTVKSSASKAHAGLAAALSRADGPDGESRDLRKDVK